jgi:hypothetical protein
VLDNVVYYTVNTIIGTDKPLFYIYYMFQPKRPSSGTRALIIPLFFPPAKHPYTIYEYNTGA